MKNEEGHLCKTFRLTVFGLSFTLKKFNLGNKRRGARPRAPSKIKAAIVLLVSIHNLFVVVPLYIPDEHCVVNKNQQLLSFASCLVA